jgi:5-methyltetrahydropteroyltriglutamate--homocysteine methyltransferase
VNRSLDRILTTHVGSLVRTRRIIEGMKAARMRKDYDQDRLAADTREGVAEVVRKQVEAGIDIPNDGEYSREGWALYINERLAGFEGRGRVPGENLAGDDDERAAFPEFFEQYDRQIRHQWMYPDVDMSGMDNAIGPFPRFKVSGPVRYKGQAVVQHDIDNLKSALKSVTVADAFITAVAPVHRKEDTEVLSHYSTVNAFYDDLIKAMNEEYKVIVAAGLILQIDYAAWNARGQFLSGEPIKGDADYQRA